MLRLNLKVLSGLVPMLIGTCPRLLCQDLDQGSKIYANSSKSVFLLVVKSKSGDVVAQGTGFLVQGGKIITNEHVVRGGSVFIDLGTVRLPASVERLDTFNDLALLSATGELTPRALAISG